MNRRVILVGTVVLGVLAGAFIVPRLARSVKDSFNKVTGREDLRVLEREAILEFRAQGTALGRTTRTPASSGPLGQSPVGTSVEQVFVVDGDPLAVLEVYRAQAQAEGWQSLGPWCSRYYRTAAYVFGKRTPIPSAMTVRVTLPGRPTAAPPPPDVVAGSAPVLTVTLTAVVSPSPEFGGVQLPMGDVGCLRSVDPGDPAFHVRPGPLRTSAELCALLPVSRLRRIVPEVTVALPGNPDYEGGNVCTYEQRPYIPTSTVLAIQGAKNSLWWFSVVDVAALPRVLFEDRQFPSTTTERDMFLLSSDVRREGPPLGVWVDTPTGPVVVRTSVDALDEEQLIAVARLLRG